ncbi:MAG: molybdopterin-dependent oxidoreductase, partial [Xanthomonadales bacterium]|nr:molybdopterin-dependent oxidoreductase [Xanthomonadales bacterium]
QMLDAPRKAYLLWGIEPEYDIDNPARAHQALAQAETVIAVASFATDSLREIADMILPLSPQPETEGSLINLDGTTMPFAAAGNPGGQARSGWKILRRLGGELGLEDFDQVDLAEVQGGMAKALEAEGAGPVRGAQPDAGLAGAGPGLFRIGELAMYSVDPLCRRAESLQQTTQAHSGFVGLNPDDAERLGLADGATARVRQGGAAIEIEVRVTRRVPAGGVWLRSATCVTRELGHAVGPIEVEVA